MMPSLEKPPSLRLAFFQMNPVVGDFSGNARKILEAARKAKEQGADMLITPEMSLVGYPAEDWLLRQDFCLQAARTMEDLAAKLKAEEAIPVIVGNVKISAEGRRTNVACLLRNGCIAATYEKQHLPEYGVFDEDRVFEGGQCPRVVEVKGIRVGLCICEDLWYPDVAKSASQAGAQLLVSINASPYEIGKASVRENVVICNAKAAGLPLCYVNCVGGQDELVFDGGSFASDKNGRVVFRQKRFEEALSVVDAGVLLRGSALEQTEVTESDELLEALTLATHDYVVKNGFKQAVLGLSGGIDSAVVAAIAARALGPENVLAVMMPTRFTADLSLTEAERLADNLGIRYVVRPIEQLFDAFSDRLAEDFVGRPWSVAEENLQARIRGTLLMAYSNKFGSLVLTTGNKSETAVGYSTLYGDTAGAFAVIKDLYKTQVWELARVINRKAGREMIPESIITRPPSAELREGQLDQESLPEYAVLDAFLRAYIEGKQSVEAASQAAGCSAETGNRIVRLIHRNEYKRRQSPIGPKVSRLAFGRDWRFPVTSRY